MLMQVSEKRGLPCRRLY